MATVAERLTAEEYFARDDPRRTELIDGAVVVNQPTVLHQQVTGAIYAALHAWTQATAGRGAATLPLDVELDDGTVLAPDVLWFAESVALDAVRAPRMPDLVVEVRSPSTWALDIGTKRDRYERHGLRELWLADTASRSVLTYGRSRPEAGFDRTGELVADAHLASPLLPGFNALVGDLLPVVG